MQATEIALRQEIRQMLNEAGINKNTLKDMAKEVMTECVKKAVTQAFHEKNIDTIVEKRANSVLNNASTEIVRQEIRRQVSSIFSNISVDIRIHDEKNNTEYSTRTF